MAIYLGVFFLSYIFCLCGEKLKRKNEKSSAANLFLIISVLLVAILAGLRDISVGSDTISYTTYYIEYGSKFTFKEFMSFFGQVYEPGFNVFGYIIGVLFHHNSNWFMFWCSLVIYGFTMKTFCYYKNKCSISMAWLFFLMLNCTEALNITRHYMAMAIAVYAFCFVFENKKRAFVIFTFIAMSFHVTAVCNFALFFVYQGLKKKDTQAFKLLVLAITILLCVSYNYIFELLAVFDFLKEKLAFYAQGRAFSFQLNPFLIRLPFLLLILFHKQNFGRKVIRTNLEEKDKIFGDFCFLVVIIEMILAQLRGIDVTLYRLTTYAMSIRYVSYSRILDISSYRANRLAAHLMAYGYMIIVFLYWVVILNSASIYPYKSAILV